jgi:hypothetical protein
MSAYLCICLLMFVALDMLVLAHYCLHVCAYTIIV